MDLSQIEESADAALYSGSAVNMKRKTEDLGFVAIQDCLAFVQVPSSSRPS